MAQRRVTSLLAVVALAAACPRAAPPPPLRGVAAPAEAAEPPGRVEVRDELGRLSFVLEVAGPGAWALRDFTGRAIAVVVVQPDRVVVQDDTGAVSASVKPGERGVEVGDGAGRVLALVKEDALGTKVLGADGHMIALVRDGAVLRDGAPVTTTLTVQGLSPLAAPLLTITELELPPRLALMAWLTLRG